MRLSGLDSRFVRSDGTSFIKRRGMGSLDGCDFGSRIKSFELDLLKYRPDVMHEMDQPVLPALCRWPSLKHDSEGGSITTVFDTRLRKKIGIKIQPLLLNHIGAPNTSPNAICF